MNKPEIIIIAALAESNRAIAKNGKLPWKIPEDSKRFQSLTLNHTVIVGRNTWEKDLKNSPLKNRNLIVISSNPEAVQMELRSINYPEEVLVCNSLKEALEKAQDPEKIFIAGGASIYAQGLELANTLELTLVEGDFEGDTFFPEYQHLIGSQFELVAKEERPGFQFETYKRIAQHGYSGS
jgi:dihydrofolate reductase